MQNVPNPETSSSIPSLLDIIENPIVPRQSLQHKEGMAIVPPVVAITPPVSAKGTEIIWWNKITIFLICRIFSGSIRVNFKEVPNVFSGLCYYYYLSDNCIKARCHLAHVVNVDKFNHKLQKLNADEAMRAFQFAMRFGKSIVLRRTYSIPDFNLKIQIFSIFFINF